MAERDKKFKRSDFEKLQNEILQDRISEIFRDDSGNYIARMEELGFTYVDEDDPEEIEEMNAGPENLRQQEIVAFFEGRRELTDGILEHYSMEKASDEPNYPLIRRYFKAANSNLKALLIYGLEKYPGRIDLLNDLSFFHEFENVLGLLIKYYTRECLHQGNLQTFSELVKDFYYATVPDGYDALAALRELVEPGSAQSKIIDFMIAEEKEAEREALGTVKF